MDVRIEESWKQVLAEEFEKPYFESLTNFVKQEYSAHKCYPPAKEIFSAFDHTPFNEVRVVIIGQDPYHGHGQANGLCFSVNQGIEHPPSLKNIFKELKEEGIKEIPESGDLSDWAKQGVLLLNASLSVRAGLARSHQNKGWEEFTDAVISSLSENREGLVFLLWGGFAKKKGKKIDGKKHHVLTTGHPSPLSANRGFWFGNKHFTKTNEILKEQNLEPINW